MNKYKESLFLFFQTLLQSTEQMDLSSELLDATEIEIRPAGSTELSWCKAVPQGTGITVLALLLSKPIDIPFLQNALLKLQLSHPILNSTLCFNPDSNTFSYAMSHTPRVLLQPFDTQSTAQILQSSFGDECSSISSFHLVLEHELNKNSWENPDPSSDADVFFASSYALENGKWVLALRFHTSVCDRASAVALLEELLGMMEEGGEGERELGKFPEGSLGIEEYIPPGQANKPFWVRGLDMVGYSMNFLRLANLSFMDTISPRMSRVVRLQMSADDTARILSRCKCEEIKLSGLFAAAGLVATRSSKGISDDQYEKYSVVTLIDCRSLLDPALSSHHIGFYHSAILNTHDVKGGEDLWGLAKRVHSSFMNGKNNKKHFTDMADMNLLMCKAIENPCLTPSASLRTSLISVFEDPVIDNPNKLHQVTSLEDVVVCSSLHGIGPSIAIFDTIRDGELDCACVFPFPVHSREQMQKLVDEMKRVLLDGTNIAEKQQQNYLS